MRKNLSFFIFLSIFSCFNCNLFSMGKKLSSYDNKYDNNIEKLQEMSIIGVSKYVDLLPYLEKIADVSSRKLKKLVIENSPGVKIDVVASILKVRPYLQKLKLHIIIDPKQNISQQIMCICASLARFPRLQELDLKIINPKDKSQAQFNYQNLPFLLRSLPNLKITKLYMCNMPKVEQKLLTNYMKYQKEYLKIAYDKKIDWNSSQKLLKEYPWKDRGLLLNWTESMSYILHREEIKKANYQGKHLRFQMFLDGELITDPWIRGLPKTIQNYQNYLHHCFPSLTQQPLSKQITLNANQNTPKKQTSKFKQFFIDLKKKLSPEKQTPKLPQKPTPKDEPSAPPVDPERDDFVIVDSFDPNENTPKKVCYPSAPTFKKE